MNTQWNNKSALFTDTRLLLIAVEMQTNARRAHSKCQSVF